jgi:hypothetical protein
MSLVRFTLILLNTSMEKVLGSLARFRLFELFLLDYPSLDCEAYGVRTVIRFE